MTELLLPVGNMEMCLAAVHHGADAVYIGVPFFNARGRTTDFSVADLKEMIDLCHLYGVRVNLAFNVVIFQDEIPQVVKLLEEILPLGPDAFIVQDLGLAQIIRSMAPLQRLHASTQMTVTNADAIKLVEDLKIDRFVLGRENSLSEIKLIRSQTDKELEVFVHGALCVAYSGQCFTSESLGGRSANRGQCAQSCRLEYEFWVDENKRDLGDKKYLVSPKDLMGIEEVPLLKEAGVDSFKVEGRLKTPAYVAAAAKNYRDVLDGKPIDLAHRMAELSTTYSRGFFSGWLHGVNHQELVDGTYSAHRGLKIGVIEEIKKNILTLKSPVELRAGMGLLFVDQKEQGSKIFVAAKKKDRFEVELVQKDLDLKKGMQVYLNSSEFQEKELSRGWQSREHMKRIPLNVFVEGRVGENLIVTSFDNEGREVRAYSASKLTPAQTKSLTPEFILDEISSLGTTVYKLNHFEAQLGAGLFLNHKELKELRRELVEKMNTARLKRVVSITPFAAPVLPRHEGQTGLNILLRTLEQVRGFHDSYESLSSLSHLIQHVILDFEFGKNYEEAVFLLKKLGLKVVIATTRILKPKEYHNLKTIVRNNPDKILVRNLGALEFLRTHCKIPLLGDFSLNVTNSFSLAYLVKKGLETINLSYDLNQKQLNELILKGDPSCMEVTLHQYMPEFHMEHCVFAAVLSKGTSFKDCGKPCEKHEVKLKDPYGNWHFLKADHECRNTFFKATPQSAGFMVKELKNLGVKSFRLEALNESTGDLFKKISTYLKLINGDIDLDQAVAQLQLVESYGLGLGQLDKTDSYKDRKKG
jgi:U32 family peptidase